ncbi:MAG: N-acetylglucosamine-6-phosphate deacetylase [Synergistaceae bacterium]|nr:N-acetylglucosamine-6-phosphate deacetylase [Synergistaceae bacterium]
MIIIKDGNVFCKDNHFHKGSIAISEGIITDTVYSDAQIIDAEGLYVIPGLTDIHFHGCAGHDFCEATTEAFRAITEYEAQNGITTLCPATMTLPENELMRIMRAARDFGKFAGIDLEGPFISKNKKGAQNPDYIVRPSTGMFRRLQAESGGLIKIAVVAPEVDGAMEFIGEASKEVTVSLAHSACDYDTALEAFRRGITHVTHLYNAMNGINHRAPGPIVAAVESEGVDVEIICDGVHVHPAVVRNTLRMFGDDRVIFISDSMEATGRPDGEYSLGGQKVIKHGNRAELEDGTIAGSVTNLMDCMRTAVRDMNIPLETAVKCAAINPARAIGLDAAIKPGNSAKLAALDKNLNLVWVMNGTDIIHTEKIPLL